MGYDRNRSNELKALPRGSAYWRQRERAMRFNRYLLWFLLWILLGLVFGGLLCKAPGWFSRWHLERRGAMLQTPYAEQGPSRLPLPDTRWAESAPVLPSFEDAGRWLKAAIERSFYYPAG